MIVELGIVGAASAAGFLGVSGKLAHQAASGLVLIALATLLFGFYMGNLWASAAFIVALVLGAVLGGLRQRDVESAEAVPQEQSR